MKSLLLTLFATAWLVGTAVAQQLEETVVPRGDLKTWNKTPGGLLDFSSKNTGVVTPQQTFKIVQSKRVPVAGGWDIWVRLQPVSGQVPECSGAGCWVYWGKQDSGQEPNLTASSQ